MSDDQLLPCPFCGGDAEIMPWHGGPKTKRLIECDNETCDVHPSVTGTFMWLLVVMWFSYRLGRILRDFKKWCP